MTWKVGTKITAGFGVALIIFLFVGAVSYRTTRQLTDTADLVAHTHLVLEGLGNVLSDLKDAETGQRGFLITGEERYLAPYQAALTAVRQHIKTVRDLTRDNPNQQRRLDALQPLIDGANGKLPELQETIDARRDKNRGFAVAQQIVLSDRGKKVMDDIRAAITEMTAEENTLLQSRSDQAQASARNAMSTILFGTLIAGLTLVAAGIVITRNIASPLRDIAAIAARMATGDLNVSVPVWPSRADEVGVLARTFARMAESLNGMAGVAGRIASGDLRGRVVPQSERDLLGTAFAEMVDNLHTLVTELTEGTNVLGSAASEIVTSTSQLAANASESAAAVNETTTTVEEVRQTAQMASVKARHVSDSAQKAAQISQSGRKSAEEAGEGMGRIRQQMEAIGASMVRLSEQSQTIGQIIATVEDLAAQSNLLAVNAAIEAAKAGEHGKGFAVVAQEVKSLAAQSRQATTEVRTLLTDIQKATATAVLATEQGGKAVDAGARQTDAAAQSIQTLAGSVAEAAQAATQIAASSQQQLVGVDQVAGAMENIKQASAQNVASAKQLEAAARNLSDLGQRIKVMVERYRI